MSDLTQKQINTLMAKIHEQRAAKDVPDDAWTTRDVSEALGTTIRKARDLLGGLVRSGKVETAGYLKRAGYGMDGRDMDVMHYRIVRDQNDAGLQTSD